jgi:hypothetical protein
MAALYLSSKDSEDKKESKTSEEILNEIQFILTNGDQRAYNIYFPKIEFIKKIRKCKRYRYRFPPTKTQKRYITVLD